MREEILRIPSATREDLVLTAFHFGNPTAKPHVAIVAGLHGDEYNGVYAAAQMVHRLTALKPEQIPGRITIIPAVNVFGLNTGSRFWPFDDTDINRMFPGYALGETTQRIAASVTAALRDATHLIDIHASNSALREVPQVRLYDQDLSVVEEARSFGLPFVWRRLPSAAVANQMTYLFSKRTPNAYILQAGSAGRINKGFVQDVVEGIGRFLTHVSAVAPGTFANDSNGTESIMLDSTRIGFCYALDAGIFVTAVSTGDPIEEGDLIGEIVSPLDGTVRATLLSPITGIVMTLRVSPVVYDNDLLARIASTEPESHPIKIRSLREDFEMQ